MTHNKIICVFKFYFENAFEEVSKKIKSFSKHIFLKAQNISLIQIALKIYYTLLVFWQFLKIHL